MRLKTAIIFLILFLFVSLVHAQDQHFIDSVVPLIKNDNSLSDMKIFFDLGFEYSRVDHSRSLGYLNRGIIIAEKVSDSLMIVKFRRMEGQVLQLAGRQQEALHIFEKILPVARRLSFEREEGFILKMLALTHTHLAHFDRALEYNFRALEHWQKENDADEIAGALINIGFTHYKVLNHDKAIDYFQQALSIAEENFLTRKVLVCYSNIGLANVAKKDFVEAKRWLSKSLEICGTDCPSEIVILSEFGLGYVTFYQSEFVSAEGHFNHSLELSVEKNNVRFEAENLLMIAKIKRLQKNYRQSRILLQRSLTISSKGGYRSLISDAYEEFFQIYKATGDRFQASKYLEKYVSLRDSIHSSDVRNKIMVVLSEFEEKENKLVLARKEELIARKEMQTRLIMLICFLSVIVAICLFVLLHRKHRSNLLLDRRVAERTRELEKSKSALERVNQEQNELLAKASQSIRRTIASQKGINTPIILQSGVVDFTHVQYYEFQE